MKTLHSNNGITTQESKILWTTKTFEEGLPTVPFEQVMEDPQGLRQWLDNIACYGFGIVSHTPPTPEATRLLAERVGYVRMDIFGGFADAAQSAPHADAGYTSGYLAAHTDGTYTYDPPGLILFHVVTNEHRGGESILIDGFYAAQTLREKLPEAFSLLTQVPIRAHYLEVDTHLEAKQPLIHLDRDNQLKRIRFNHMDRAPFYWGEKTAQVYDALWEWRKIIDDLDNQCRFKLTPGNVLLFSNWRLLHGRLAYEGKRRMVNCYLNMEDFDSRRRILNSTRENSHG